MFEDKAEIIGNRRWLHQLLIKIKVCLVYNINLLILFVVTVTDFARNSYCILSLKYQLYRHNTHP